MLAIGTSDFFEVYTEIRLRLELGLLLRVYSCTHHGEMNDADVFVNEEYRRTVKRKHHKPCFTTVLLGVCTVGRFFKVNSRINLWNIGR
jgi:hypothetical protein